jgi:hypothetical protein
MSSFRLNRSVLASAVLLFPRTAFAQYAGAKPVPDDLKKGFDAISASDAKKWLSYLAGPECQGRGTGQPGFQKAADYVAARFKEFGLKPIGDDGTYFQGVPFVRSQMDPKVSFLSNADGTGRMIASKNFTFGGSGDLDLTAPVVFVHANGNAAIPSPDALKGKIVVMFADGGSVSRRLRQDLFRAEMAMMLTVAEKVGEPGWSVRRGKLADFRPGRVTGGTISLAAAKSLMKSQGVEESFASKVLATDTMEVSQGTKDIKISSKSKVEEVKVPNVVGLLEGSDPILKDEVVAVGSHLDHLGTDGNNIWYGADDDGSGSTAVLAIAKAFSSNPIRPKRSVLFMTFCGEEMGLLGSAYYVQNPIIPLEKTQCLMQMDMVGRDSFGAQNGDQKRIDKLEENHNTMRLVGSKRISQEYDDIIQEVNQHVGFVFKYDAEDVYTRSDHYNFARNGVPIAFQFCGFTPDYHQPTDTVDKINFDKIANAAKLCYLTLMKVGNMDGKLKRNPG